ARFEEEENAVVRSGQPSLDQELLLPGRPERRGSGARQQEQWLSISRVPLRDPDGKIVGLVGICHDITQRKAAARELELARQAAEAASRAKSAFLANVSHEIRTPMNAIVGMTEMVLDTELSAQQRDHLQLVRSSAESLLTVLNDILDFSKIEAG